MKKILFVISMAATTLAAISSVPQVSLPAHTSDISSDSLARRWDEAIPLGNATVGALIWQRGDSVVRMSLDRTDLWDLRPSDSLSGPDYSFRWVKEHIRSGNYEPVQRKFDWPYNSAPAPSKIPGAAIEFTIPGLSSQADVRLSLADALCTVTWPGGTILTTFVHATQPVGWFRFENLPQGVVPAIAPPRYEDSDAKADNSHAGAAITYLGYSQGTVTITDTTARYHQPGWEDFAYDLAVRWKRHGSTLTGVWSLTSSLSHDDAVSETDEAMTRGMEADFADHQAYWTPFWQASSISVPDSVLQAQYDREMYKLGSAARADSYPISLQAVWTADNGFLPPWKGDYHHDLNTQLSYWPVYAGNHLQEGLGYLNTLWNQRDIYRHYTRQFFGLDGINIPGVCTLTGEPMGGWMQYSMSQTVSAWLAQHFYLHWKYSGDPDFLRDRAYPFVRDVAVFLEQATQVGSDSVRTFEFSTSPEINDNSLQAWFHTITNYDLALTRALFRSATEMAQALGHTADAERWTTVMNQLPAFDTDSTGALTFAKGHPYNQSHRHFSHAMAIHPLGIIDYSGGDDDRRTIDATLALLKEKGPSLWVGYSYSWYGAMLARALRGDDAAEALRTFATCFCLPNSFHANGDQSRTGKSAFTYRPFTLEGNFAFASAMQEMLMQSHTGVISIFPAIPADWTDVAFIGLRAMGGVLVSATRSGGHITDLKILSEHGGPVTIKADGKIVTVDAPRGEWHTVAL